MPRRKLLLSPEARLLLLTINPAREASDFRALLGDEAFDWNRLVILAEKEKAVPALWHVLRELPDDLVPADRRDQLSKLTAVSEFRMLHLQRLLAGALDTLAGHGTRAMLLKGAGLALTSYGSFRARPMYDVDLLVPRDECAQAWDALRAAGWVHDEKSCPRDRYDAHHHMPPLDDPMRTGLSLELHSAACDEAVGLTPEDMWSRSRRVDVGGREAWVACEAHQLIHLAVHFAWSHSLDSAAWRTFRDTQQLTRSGTFDWNELLRVTAGTRAASSVYWTLRLARSLAGVAVPDQVLNELRPPRPERMLAILERHYTSNLFRFSPAACPSAALNKLLWSAGMAPRWSGHGAARPWTRDDEIATSTDSRMSAAGRVRRQLAGIRWWTRYVGAVLSPSR
jgi:hypothetical protein